ncbi:hypothetical protein BXY57_1803 [Thermoflavifilum aggregans]|uniref:Uncharacterized protein n=1 Tax=Thermoflavifilum aggregans TaxID=454188 RepID=A0A2M9CWF1_9BACT|nr:hypothetical protein BXY57_1803 [Thermoflavifilum aggregans]
MLTSLIEVGLQGLTMKLKMRNEKLCVYDRICNNYFLQHAGKYTILFQAREEQFLG